MLVLAISLHLWLFITQRNDTVYHSPWDSLCCHVQHHVLLHRLSQCSLPLGCPYTAPCHCCANISFSSCARMVLDETGDIRESAQNPVEQASGSVHHWSVLYTGIYNNCLCTETFIHAWTSTHAEVGDQFCFTEMSEEQPAKIDGKSKCQTKLSCQYD